MNCGVVRERELWHGMKESQTHADIGCDSGRQQ